MKHVFTKKFFELSPIDRVIVVIAAKGDCYGMKDWEKSMRRRRRIDKKAAEYGVLPLPKEYDSLDSRELRRRLKRLRSMGFD